MLTKTQQHCFIQKSIWINLLIPGLILTSLTISFLSQGQTIKTLPVKNYAGYSKEEVLWASIDFQKLKQDVIIATGISVAEQDLFFLNYIGSEKYPDERFDFFRKASAGEITEANLNTYVESLKQKYISIYPDFLKNKELFAERIREINSAITALAANGPCTNIDFEEGTTNGWSGTVANACTNPTPCGPFVNGINPTRHVITNTSMTDPFIPTLPVVAPGGNFSLKLEDYDKGGKASIIRQTFAVTPTNNLFTYRYAAVLEDPGDHDDDERPYFKVRLYDQNGKEIKCASYTAIAKPPLQNFTYIKSAGKNLYYRNWSTVSLPLDAYEGQNVTIEFIASDCALGAHLGYAYIDGSCSAIVPMPQTTVCNGSTADLKATDGFASYKWAGPGIVGNNNQQTVKVNKGGTYTVTLTPFADNPCPTTQSVDVYERCLPPPVQVSLCETVKGSGTVTKVNLLNYNTVVTAYHAAPVSVKSWHSGFPATAANAIVTPSSLTVSSGSKFYAVIDYATLGGDTAELDFKINGLPTVVFPNISPVCKGSSAFQISGVSPVGGVFSGTNVTASGSFNPATDGSFNVKYLYTDANGCKDSLTKPAVVQAPPTINAGPDQTLCANASKVDLTGSRTIAKGAHWSGGAGTYTPHADSVKTSYTPTSGEKTGSLTLTLTSTGNGVCPAVSDNIKISFIPVPTVNAGPDQTLCASTTTVTLAPTFTNNSTQNWSGGNGTVSTDLKTYTPTAGEINSGTITLKLTVNGNTPCPAISDDVTIKFSPIPTVNAGPDQTLCANNTTATLTASVTNLVSGSWTGGAGSFSAANNANSTYTPTASEISAGSVTLTFTNTGKSPCPAVKDDLILKIIPTPAANAGPDQTLCASATTVTLAPAFSNSSSQSWSGGSGAVSADLKTYTPTATEISTGTVTLKLTAQGNTPCAAVNDDVVIKFSPIPTVDAGPDQTLCANNNTATLAASVTNLVSGSWTGGAGSFSASNNANSTYTPTAAETSAGTVTLTFTNTGKSPCPAVKDDLVLKIIPAPTVNAGPDQTLCASATSVNLVPTFTNSSSQSWSGGSGNVSADLKTYTPTAGEITSGTITLKLTAKGNIPCAAVNDDVIIKFNPGPTVDAGVDQSVCANNATATLSATVSNMVTGSWSGGNGSFSAANSISSTYTPTPSEVQAGTVTLTFTNTGQSQCPPAKDALILKIIPAPTVNAGPDQTLCASTTTVALAPNFTNSSTQNWSGGKGTVSNDLKTYTPTANEISTGTITLKLTANGNSPCAAVNDNVVIKFSPIPTVNAGPDQTLCANNNTATLSATVTNLVTGNWSGGSGNFSAVSNTNSTYTPTAAETSSGTVKLTFTNNGQSPCPAVKDELVLKIIPAPTADAGQDQTLCANTTTVTLIPAFTNSSSQSWSGGSGTVSSDLKTYTPTAGEISSGTVTLKLTAKGNTPCAAVNDDMTIKFSPVPVIDAGPDQNVCEDKPLITLNAVPVNLVNGKWTGGSGSFSDDTDPKSTYNPTSTEIQNGVVKLTYTNNGQTPCPAVKDEVIVNIIKLPVADAGPDFKVCKDTTLNLNTTAITNVTYSWDESGNAIGSGSSINYTVSKDALITLTATDNFGCKSTDKAVISTVIPPVLSLAGPYCFGTGLELKGTLSNTLTGKIEWFRNGELIANQSQPNLTVDKEGSYTIRFTYGSCSRSAQTNVFSPPVLDKLKDLTLCEATKIPLLVNQIPGGIYQWKQGSTLLPDNGNNTEITVVAGPQKYHVQVSDVNTCIAVDSILITGIPLPKVTVRDTAICAGASAQFKAIVSNLNQLLSYNPTYSWKKDGNNLSGSGDNIVATEAGVYNISVNAKGCEGSGQAVLKINPLPKVDAPGVVKFCDEKDHNAVLDAGAGYRYHWTASNDSTRTITVSTPGVYHFKITDQNNCSSTGRVTLENICPPRLFVADAFTPDGDGVNDLYNVYGAHIGRFHMLIFNRWGEIIFESKDRTHVWDGIYKDQPMQSGVYPWVITYEGDTEEYKGPYNLKGSVTVVR